MTEQLQDSMDDRAEMGEHPDVIHYWDTILCVCHDYERSPPDAQQPA